MQIGERAYQSFSPEVRQSSDGKRTVIIISAGTVDRHGTIIDVRGMDLSAFKRNPVVLYNHDYNVVVGRAANINLRGEQLVAEVEWDMEDEFAAGIARKMRGGFLNAASVGFIVRQSENDSERGAVVISESELVEFSIVPVPSNREALVLSRNAQDFVEMQQQVESLRAEIEQLKAARQAPEPSAPVANDETPAEDAADSVPDAEAAKQTGEVLRQPEQVAPESHQPAREATEADYRAIAQAMAPVIRQQVLRALGKA